VFLAKGFTGASLDELAAAAGLNRPSLYAAFGDKERLFLEAVDRYQCGPGDSARVLADAPTARVAIERLLVEAAAELTRPDHPAGCMIVTSAMNCSAGSAHLHGALRDRRVASEARIKAAIDSGVKRRELPAGTSAAALAKFYMTVLEGMTIQARDGATREQLLAVAETALRAWPASAPSPQRRSTR